MTFDDVVPRPARIAAIVPESPDTRTFSLVLEPPVPALEAARPGQFVMLSLLGHGEAAFTLSDLPAAGAPAGTATLTVRRVGSVTGALFDLRVGERVGLRGPFGRGFPEEPAEPTVYVAGGCGLAPLRAAIARQIATRPPGTPVAIVYGARDPGTRILRAALAAWERTPDVYLVECVERAAPGCQGAVGLVVEFIDAAVSRVGARRAALC